MNDFGSIVRFAYRSMPVSATTLTVALTDDDAHCPPPCPSSSNPCECPFASV